MRSVRRRTVRMTCPWCDRTVEVQINWHVVRDAPRSFPEMAPTARGQWWTGEHTCEHGWKAEEPTVLPQPEREIGTTSRANSR